MIGQPPPELPSYWSKCKQLIDTNVDNNVNLNKMHSVTHEDICSYESNIDQRNLNAHYQKQKCVGGRFKLLTEDRQLTSESN